jgi:hypothetical protein
MEEAVKKQEEEIEVPDGKMHVKVYAPFKTYIN